MIDRSGTAAAERAPLISLDRVTKRFGRALAVDDLSLSIRDGEFLCLLGPSGCGKSTLLRLLAGFETPDAGRILLEGRDITREPPHRRPLNIMFQSYALFPHLSVAANVGYGLRWLPLTRAERRDRVAEMLRLVQLEELAERRPDRISGGQRQRVALARALARQPRLLLLDEPLTALDRRLREETRTELKALQAKLGTTFVTVTHDQEEAMGMADRIAVMERGRLVQAGSPREVYEVPANRFVASFLGEVNLISGRVLDRADGLLRVQTPLCEQAVMVAAPQGRDPAEGDLVQVALRPERIGLLHGLAGDAPNAFAAEIVAETYLGATLHLRVRVADGSLLRVAAGPATATGRVGRTVRLGFAPSAATILD
ncbi:MAG: polyamine transporter ATP-binding protein [Enterovirga sp.]|nr:polyamine transporter ATP-binding protein [Enterovirga sp.]